MQSVSRSLTPRQRRCARYLGLGLTQRAAARRLGMDERSVRRWLSLPAFVALVEQERESGHNDSAEDVLLDLLNSSDERVRLAAARELRRSASGASVPEPDDALIEFA